MNNVFYTSVENTLHEKHLKYKFGHILPHEYVLSLALNRITKL